jgi:hypothetical protein
LINNSSSGSSSWRGSAIGRINPLLNGSGMTACPASCE